jgi:uncharacterized protein YbdZ (MbtH family)
VKNPLQDRFSCFPEQADIPSWHDVPAKSIEKKHYMAFLKVVEGS